jgi:L-ascorbate metabolism protein UlaG (beta-lactamase superfamily)
MKLELLDGCTFLIISDEGVRIIVDPYMHNYIPENPPPGPESNRPPVAEFADIVTISHAHFNYSYVYTVKGVPQLYSGGAPAEIKGVKFTSAVGWHYDTEYESGPQGLVNMIGIEVDGIRMRHMGDYGQKELLDEQLQQIGKVDILMTRWLDWTPKLLEQIKPKVVIPMHAEKPDAFMNSLKGFTQMNASDIEFEVSTLPKEMKCILLKPSRIAP